MTGYVKLIKNSNGMDNSSHNVRFINNKFYLIEWRLKIMLEKMREIIAAQLNVDVDTVKAESNFKEDLNADSLDLFELVMSLEDEYSVEIPSEDLEKLVTVQDVCDYLTAKGVTA